MLRDMRIQEIGRFSRQFDDFTARLQEIKLSQIVDDEVIYESYREAFSVPLGGGSDQGRELMFLNPLCYQIYMRLKVRALEEKLD
jgi:hypothetical protein